MDTIFSSQNPQNIDSVVSLNTDQNVINSISGSAVGFFSSGELFHGLNGLAVSVFEFPFFLFCFVLSCIWRRPLHSPGHR